MGEKLLGGNGDDDKKKGGFFFLSFANQEGMVVRSHDVYRYWESLILELHFPAISKMRTR